jgi:hypothetical protein
MRNAWSSLEPRLVQAILQGLIQSLRETRRSVAESLTLRFLREDNTVVATENFPGRIFSVKAPGSDTVGVQRAASAFSSS